MSGSSARETAIRRWFQYLEKVVGVSGERLSQFEPTLEHALSRLAVIFRDDPRLAFSHLVENALFTQGHGGARDASNRT